MKTKLSNYQLVHVWANQEQEHGVGSNMFFERDTIYSYGYHFPICKIENVSGENYYLFTTSEYSNTTAKHKHLVLRAIPDQTNIIKVKKVDICPGNVDFMVNDIKETIQKDLKARFCIYTDKIIEQVENLKKYCSLFGFNVPCDFCDEIKMSISLQAQKEANKLKQDERKVKTLEEREQAKKEKLLKDIDKFHSFKLNNISSSRYDYLRVNGDYVETSRGVKVDARLCRIIYCMINSGKDMTGRHLENYTIQTVNEECIKVGCHTFQRTEVDNIIGTL